MAPHSSEQNKIAKQMIKTTQEHIVGWLLGGGPTWVWDVGGSLVIVEIQAQHWPDQLCKPRTGSGGTDWLGRTGARR